MEARKRVLWIDAAKAFGILLVIIGHTIVNEKALQLIYSFHMPMFFIASSITTKRCESTKQFKLMVEKAFRKLIPLACFLTVILQLHYFDYHFCRDKLFNFFLTCLYQRGESVSIAGIGIVNAMGLPWFLFALFHGKILFGILDIIENEMVINGTEFVKKYARGGAHTTGAIFVYRRHSN